MNKQAPNSAIDTATPQAQHRSIANAAVTESRSPSQVLKDSQQRVVDSATNGPQPTDIAGAK